MSATATAQGTPTGVALPIRSNPTTLTLHLTGTPAITLVTSALQSTFTAVGQTIDYAFVVTNPGNLTLRSVGITDTHTGLNGRSCPSTSLAPQQVETCTATYAVTHNDISAGSIVDTATAHGTPVGSSTPVTTPPATVTIPLGSWNRAGRPLPMAGPHAARPLGVGGDPVT
jgi:hypothetical protein